MILSLVYLLVRCLLGCLTVLTRRQVSKDAGLLVLRHENAVLRRQIGRVRYRPGDRLWLAAVSRLVPRRRWGEVFTVTPATLLDFANTMTRKAIARSHNPQLPHNPGFLVPGAAPAGGSSGTVRGRPGRLGRDLAAWRRASRSRCQRSTVSGRTSTGTGTGTDTEPAQHIPWEPVQQGGQERPVGQGEPRPGLTQLPLQDDDLVAQRQDLHLLGLVAHRKKPQ